MVFQDWRDASADTVQPLYAAECARWRVSLGWDYQPSCAVLETARREGRLPGYVARDEIGLVRGWTYFLMHDRRLQIGALVGDDDVVAGRLLDAVLRSPEARAARGVSCFLYPNVPSLEHTLTRSRLNVSRHAYLRRPLARPNVAPPAAGRRDRYHVREWTPGRIPELAELFASAYKGMPEGRCFALTGTAAEWVIYLGQLAHGSSCGRFAPDLSAIVETDRGRAVATVLVTMLAAETAHVAQVAVARRHRGRGLGERLVETACDRAYRCGCEHVTLLVAESNTTARRLYARLGFEHGATFLFGSSE